MVTAGNYCAQRQHICEKCSKDGTCLVTGCLDFTPTTTVYSSNTTSATITYIPRNTVTSELTIGVMCNCQICDEVFTCNYGEKQYICNDCKQWLKHMKEDYKKAAMTISFDLQEQQKKENKNG